MIRRFWGVGTGYAPEGGAGQTVVGYNDRAAISTTSPLYLSSSDIGFAKFRRYGRLLFAKSSREGKHTTVHEILAPHSVYVAVLWLVRWHSSTVPSGVIFGCDCKIAKQENIPL